MHASWLIVAVAALLGSVDGQIVTSTLRQNSTTRQSTSTRSTTASSRLSSSVRLSSSIHTSSTSVTTHAPSQTSNLPPCARVSLSLSAANSKATKTPYLSPILAMSCLESIPLHVQRSLKFIDYISPFIEFQSTLAYLKDPPVGYPMAGVDVLDGLSVIRAKVSRMTYQSQYEFERELHILINVRPRDFHFNLPLPLVDLFSFTTPDASALASVSIDGVALPEIYFLTDLFKLRNSSVPLSWKPSHIELINGQRAADYVLRAGLETQQWADPDAIYNRMFITPALAQSEGGNSWVSGGHLYGFSTDSTTYQFANQSTLVLPNYATTYRNFSGINTGEDVFQKFEVPVLSTTLKKRSDSGKTKRVVTSTVTSVPGYPTPVVLDPASGYTGGYFLPNSTIAVLVMTAFEGSDDEGIYLQQELIKKFLAKCKTAGKTKLIIDVQANGGGYVFNGQDTFIQLFPNLQILGATRTRYTPMVGALSNMYAAAGVRNNTFSTSFAYQDGLDVNLKDFKSPQDFLGPTKIYGDNFTSILRPNLTNSDEEIGVANLTAVAPQVFSADNMVLLLDGLCGSTCAIFAELMASQGGVRSVSVGGRPMSGPMQTVAGSKGAQVLTYGNIQNEWGNINQFYQDHKLKVPALENAARYNISLDDPPIGGDLSTRARFNLRNNYNSTSATETPLQFVYEPANCRLYWQSDDLFDMANLWKKVAEVTWGSRKCVSGSSANSDDTMPKHAYQLKAYDSRSFSNFTLNPGLPGTVYYDVNAKSTEVVFTIGNAIAALWAW